MYFINNRLGINYLYVNYLLVIKSLVDFMGLWLYYIFLFVGIDIVIFFFMYLLFRRNKKLKYGSWRSY